VLLEPRRLETVAVGSGVKFVELPTGVRLVYAERGDSAGIPLLLLPGLGDSCRSFEPVLEHLPESIRAIALTQRGHGDATHPSEGYHFHDFAADLEAFMGALDLPAAVVVAHSASGFFAQRFAIDHPQRVLGLVFVGSPLTLRHHAGLREAWDRTFSRLADPIDPSFIRDMQAGTLAKPIPQEFFETLVAEAMKVPARVWKQAFQHLLEDDLGAELSKIDAPTLIVWGDRDGVVSRIDQDALVAAIKGTRLLVYDGGGHSPHWEEPSRFASDLAGFVESLERSDGRGNKST
jgi:pimeloyl-ACP methyl ester carboxylesterase